MLAWTTVRILGTTRVGARKTRGGGNDGVRRVDDAKNQIRVWQSGAIRSAFAVDSYRCYRTAFAFTNDICFVQNGIARVRVHLNVRVRDYSIKLVIDSWRLRWRTRGMGGEDVSNYPWIIKTLCWASWLNGRLCTTTNMVYGGNTTRENTPRKINWLDTTRCFYWWRTKSDIVKRNTCSGGFKLKIK